MKSLDRSKHSHAYENMMEHAFLSDVLRHMWYDRAQVVEVAKAQVDSWGYDLILTVGGTARYVQLKTSVPADVNERLAQRRGGCIVAVLPDEHAANMFYRLWEAKTLKGLAPAKATVYKRGRTERAVRTGHRTVPAGKFSKPAGVEELCAKLFPLGLRR
jgi:hypothetical protein